MAFYSKIRPEINSDTKLKAETGFNAEAKTKKKTPKQTNNPP